MKDHEESRLFLGLHLQKFYRLMQHTQNGHVVILMGGSSRSIESEQEGMRRLQQASGRATLQRNSFPLPASLGQVGHSAMHL